MEAEVQAHLKPDFREDLQADLQADLQPDLRALADLKGVLLLLLLRRLLCFLLLDAACCLLLAAGCWLLARAEKHAQVALKLLPNSSQDCPQRVPKSIQKGSREALGTLPGLPRAA